MQIKCFHVESTSCPASVVFSPAILVDQDTHGFPLVIRYDTRGRDDDDDSLIPRCCRISVTHDNVVSIRKHRARAHARTYTQSVETGLLPSIAFRQWTDIFPFFVRSSFAIFIVSPWRHAGLPCFLFDYSTRSLLESKSTIENFREDSEIRSSLRIFWNWKDFDVFLNDTLLLVRRFRFVYTIVLILQVCYMYSNF